MPAAARVRTLVAVDGECTAAAAVRARCVVPGREREARWIAAVEMHSLQRRNMAQSAVKEGYYILWERPALSYSDAWASSGATVPLQVLSHAVLVSWH